MTKPRRIVTDTAEEWIGGRGFTCKCLHRGNQHRFLAVRMPEVPFEHNPVVISYCTAPGCECKGFAEEKRRYARSYRNGAHEGGRGHTEKRSNRDQFGRFVRWFGEEVA